MSRFQFCEVQPDKFGMVIRYSKQITLSGIIHVRAITDNRTARSPSKNLHMLGNLVGDVATTQVRLVSTMWEKVEPETGEWRDSELRKTFYRPFIEKGSKMECLRTATGEEAWRIVDGLIDDIEKRDALLLQEELVELELKLNEMAAGKTLYSSLPKLLADQEELLRSLLAQVEKANDLRLTRELEKEYVKIRDQFERMFQDVAKLKIPLGRQIMLYCFGKKTRAKAIKVSQE